MTTYMISVNKVPMYVLSVPVALLSGAAVRECAFRLRTAPNVFGRSSFGRR